MTTTPQTPTDIIKDNKTLNSILVKARYLTGLNALVLDSLPSNLRSHCKVANMSDGVLSLQVDSANWATQLRYAIPALTTALRKHKPFANLVNIKHRVQPRTTTAKKTTPTTKPLSAEARKALQITAKMVNHPELAEALHRCAAKTEKST